MSSKVCQILKLNANDSITHSKRKMSWYNGVKLLKKGTYMVILHCPRKFKLNFYSLIFLVFPHIVKWNTSYNIDISWQDFAGVCFFQNCCCTFIMSTFPCSNKYIANEFHIIWNWLKSWWQLVASTGTRILHTLMALILNIFIGSTCTQLGRIQSTDFKARVSRFTNICFDLEQKSHNSQYHKCTL